MCDYIATIQVCVSELQDLYCNKASAFKQDQFWDFKALEEIIHNAILMAWIGPGQLDLNKAGEDELYFTPAGAKIPAMLREEKVLPAATQPSVQRVVHDKFFSRQ